LAAKQNLDEQVSVIEQQISNMDSKIAALDELIAKTEVKLKDAKAKEQEQYQLFCTRVRSMEETGTVSYWAILFQASSFTDLLDRAMLVNEVVEYDTQVENQLKQARMDVESYETELKSDRSDQQSARDEQVQAKKELDSKIDEANNLLNSIQGNEEAIQATVKQIEADEASVNQQIANRKAALEELIRQNQSQFVDSTDFCYPLPTSYNRISSPFGYRIHPITGEPNYHTGIDLPAPRGTPIRAVKSGIVSISDYNGSYGNYVVIEHANGYSSLYGHMSSRAVSENETVKQGQVIGYVGSTGSSTGNHLHLEIRKNGTRINPASCFPGIFS